MLSKILSFNRRSFSRKANSYEQALLHDLMFSVKFDSQNRIASIPESPCKLDPELDHAPKRTHTLTPKQVDVAIRNHLIYFTKDLHDKLEPIFRQELNEYGHIYMFNYLPKVKLEAVPIYNIPALTDEGRAMTHMILNNLDPRVA